MNEAAKANAVLSLQMEAMGDYEAATWYFRQAWSLCLRTTLKVRRAAK